jgi:hypothetical protein
MKQFPKWFGPRCRRGWPMLLVWAVVGAVSGCGNGPSAREAQAPASGNAIERTAARGPVAMTVRLSPSHPRLSDLVHLEVAIEAPRDVEITPPAFGKSLGDFLIRDYSVRPLESRGEKLLQRMQYQLEPAHAGLLLIYSVAAEFIDRRPDAESRGEATVIESDPIEITVSSEFDDAVPDLAQLAPMMAPREVPSRVSDLVYGSVALLAGVLACCLWFWRRRKPAAKAAVSLSPGEIARQELDRLLAENLPERGLYKEFFLRLTGIVRQYIEETTGLRAPEQTTEEFLADMRKRATFTPEQAARLAEFLEAADMIKYAGQNPRSGQIDDSIARAREFILLEKTPVANRHLVPMVPVAR